MFQTLRKRRRLLGIGILVTLTVWLSAMFAGCLLPGMQSLSDMAAVTMTDARSHAAMADGSPCPPEECALMQSDRRLAAGSEVAPTVPKPLLAVLILAVVILAVTDHRQGVPRPPAALLPRHPPFLRFYALRI